MRSEKFLHLDFTVICVFMGHYVTVTSSTQGTDFLELRFLSSV